MKKFVLIALSITMLAMAGCSAGQQGSSSQSQISSAPQSSQADVPQIPENPDLYQYTDLQEGETIATIHTTLGDIKVRFSKTGPQSSRKLFGPCRTGVL